MGSEQDCRTVTGNPFPSLLSAFSMLAELPKLLDTKLPAVTRLGWMLPCPEEQQSQGEPSTALPNPADSSAALLGDRQQQTLQQPARET